MIVYRYEVKTPNNKTFGIFTGGFDYRGQDLTEKHKKAESWLITPENVESSWEFWFTVKGMLMYEKYTLPFHREYLHCNWEIQKNMMFVDDTPKYQDEYQVAF